ncbi:hypothetical protein [Peptostreptococcus faecalis]|nr:hypothetical protein [Peptostreptococcus faecalis]
MKIKTDTLLKMNALIGIKDHKFIYKCIDEAIDTYINSLAPDEKKCI